ncbi:MAG: hypothetical protein R3F37_02710 [Candidatus Competibacteraceae bacterium]
MQQATYLKQQREIDHLQGFIGTASAPKPLASSASSEPA